MYVSLQAPADRGFYWRASGEDENGLPEKVNLYVICYMEYPYNKLLTFVLWPVPLPLWALGAGMLRSGVLARRRALGFCRVCGYDLAGLCDEVVCPECGRRE